MMRHFGCYGGLGQWGGDDLSDNRSGLVRSMIVISIATGAVVWGLAIWKVMDLFG